LKLSRAPRVLVCATIMAVSTFTLTTEGSAQPVRQGTVLARVTKPRFVDVTSGMELPIGKRANWGTVFFDYNRDGRPDIFLNRHTHLAALFINHGASFVRHQTKVFHQKPAGLSAFDRHGCAWGEANRDGRPDLFCVSGAQRGKGRGPNQLLINTGTDFVDRSRKYGVRDPKGRGRSVNWLDYNGDSRLDLFIGNDRREGYPNRLYKGRRRSSFSRASVGLSQAMATSSSLAWDWDRDRDPDLLVTSMKSPTTAYRNAGSRFISVPFRGITGRPWLSGASGDYNGDGWTDLVLVSERRVVVWRNKRGTFVRERSVAVKQGNAAAWLDVDNDSDLDLFVVQGRRHGVNQPDFLLKRHGGSFRRAAHPSYRGPRKGGGDSLSLADFNRDGRVDVLVSNSWKKIKAPIALLQNKTPRRSLARTRAERRATQSLRIWGQGSDQDIVPNTVARSYRWSRLPGSVGGRAAHRSRQCQEGSYQGVLAGRRGELCLGANRWAGEHSPGSPPLQELIVEGREPRAELGVGLLDHFRHNLRLSDHGHEVGVSTPTRHDVHVNVAGDSRPRDGAEVDSNVETVCAHRAADDRDRLRGEFHELCALALVEITDVADVSYGRHHEMPCVVGKGVDDHEAPLASVEDASCFVVILGEVVTENAALVVSSGARHVLAPPRRPQSLHPNYVANSKERESISLTMDSTKSSIFTPRVSSPVRRRTETVCDSASLSPTTSM
jgi:hypothetical protein